MDFSAKLDELEQRAADAKTSAQAAVSESRDQLRQRIDQAQVDVNLAVKDARPPTSAPSPRARATAPPTARHVATGAPRRSSCPPTKSEGGRDVHRRLLGSILRCRPAEDGQICLSSDHGRLVQACQSQSPAPL